MRSTETRRPGSAAPLCWRAPLAALLAGLLLAAPAFAGPPPPPPSGGGPPPPPAWDPGPPPPDYDPGYDPGPPPDDPAVGSPPPPLPVAMRVVYAPFYVAGLVVRYGLYYVLVAPFEVLFRTIDYGVEGGVEHDPDAGH
jgi:hypothetical protein